MLSLIVFGIIALITIVFLLSFNIKTISRPEKAALQIDKQSELPVDSDSVSSSVLSDEQYRQALRKFHLSLGEKPLSTSINRLNDTAYRTAVRSMKNQTKKD